MENVTSFFIWKAGNSHWRVHLSLLCPTAWLPYGRSRHGQGFVGHCGGHGGAEVEDNKVVTMCMMLSVKPTQNSYNLSFQRSWEPANNNSFWRNQQRAQISPQSQQLHIQRSRSLKDWTCSFFFAIQNLLRFSSRLMENGWLRTMTWQRFLSQIQGLIVKFLFFSYHNHNLHNQHDD